MCLVNFFATYGNVISTVALVITLIVLILYACETRRLRKETVKQTELSLRPYIILNCSPIGDLDFENIGLSHALDVLIDSLEMNVFKINFQPCNLVRQGKSIRVRAIAEGKNPETSEMIRALVAGDLGFPFFENLGTISDYPLTVHYKNIAGTPYYTKLEVKIKEKRIVVVGSKKAK